MGAIKCIKYFLFSFNVVFWLAGMGALGVGIWMYIWPGSVNDYMGNYSFKIPAIILMASGSVVMVTGFCGCLGAIKESRCLLGSFFCMLLLIFCAEIACGVLGFLFRNRIETEIKTKGKDLILNKYGVDIDLTHSVAKTQQKFECCGSDSPSDYLNSKWKQNNPAKTVPNSCCKSNTCSPVANQYSKGCYEKIKTYALDHMLIIGGIAIGLGCIQLLGMVFALCLFFSIDNY